MKTIMTRMKGLQLVVAILATVLSLTSCRDNMSNRGINIINLYGDWHQMGCQYGTAAKPMLEDVLCYIDAKLQDEEPRMSPAADIADKLYANYPDYLKEFFAGASETSGLSLDRLKLCNALEYIEGCFFCSAMAAWGDYSKDGLIYGRNYDAESYLEIGRDIVVTVFHPTDGPAAAIIGYAGEIYCVNGFNENGIFIELNNGMPSAGWDIHWDMRPGTTELFDLLFKARSLNDVDAFFNSTRSAASFIIGVADANEARLYEWCYDGAKRSDSLTPNGLMLATNHYVNPEWAFATPCDADSWNSLTRRANMAQRAQDHKGGIDVGAMKDLMSTPIEAGGPYHDKTRYQIIVEPGRMMLHLNVVGGDGWVSLEMGELFAWQSK